MTTAPSSEGETKWVTYSNYGNMPLRDVMKKLWPWLTDEEAARIAEECERLKSPHNVPEGYGALKDRCYLMARHAYKEAHKLRR